MAVKRRERLGRESGDAEDQKNPGLARTVSVQPRQGNIDAELEPPIGGKPLGAKKEGNSPRPSRDYT